MQFPGFPSSLLVGARAFDVQQMKADQDPALTERLIQRVATVKAARPSASTSEVSFGGTVKMSQEKFLAFQEKTDCRLVEAGILTIENIRANRAAIARE